MKVFMGFNPIKEVTEGVTLMYIILFASLFFTAILNVPSLAPDATTPIYNFYLTLKIIFVFMDIMGVIGLMSLFVSTKSLNQEFY
jgi:hypothetical protein